MNSKISACLFIRFDINSGFDIPKQGTHSRKHNLPCEASGVIEIWDWLKHEQLLIADAKNVKNNKYKSLSGCFWLDV